MNRQWIKVFSLLLNMTSIMTLISAGVEVPAQALEAISVDVILHVNLAPIGSKTSTTPLDLFAATSWRSAGRGLPGGRVGGAGR